MKRLSMVIVAFALSLMAADYSGIWNGKGGIESAKYGTVPQTAQMTINQAGSSISGTLKLGNADPVAITSGTVSGTTITLAAGNTFTANLTASGSQLVGKVTTSRGEVMDVVFTQQH